MLAQPESEGIAWQAPVPAFLSCGEYHFLNFARISSILLFFFTKTTDFASRKFKKYIKIIVLWRRLWGQGFGSNDQFKIGKFCKFNR